MAKIKKGDTVIVTTGKDKGLTAKVLQVMTENNGQKKYVIENANLVLKHTKPSKESSGGIVRKPAPIDSSNVALLNIKTGKAEKVGYKILDDGSKVRYFKQTNELVDA